MSATKRGKQKQQAEVSEEEDFETFVRESLGQLSKGQKQIIQDISNLKAKVLSALTKIFERCILNQLSFYPTYEDILVPNQYGFRPRLTAW